MMASPFFPKEKNRCADVVRKHYVDLQKILSNFPEVLFSVTMMCFQDSLIDMNTKTTITNFMGQYGSSILLDHIHTKLEQSDDYLPLVLSIFREEVSLKDVVGKMESFVAKNVKAKETVSEQTGSTVVVASSDIVSVVSSAEKLMESFDALMFMLMSIISQTNINLPGLKLKINLFLQYARENTPEVQPILDDMEDRCHSPEGVVLFLVNRNLLGYLNFELLNVFKQFLPENYEISDKIAEYKSKHKVFICQNLKNIVHIFRENPRLAPASVVGLPTIGVHLTEPWQGKSYYQWKEIMENIVDWPDHLLIKSIDFKCVIITYHVLPFILSRVVNDLTNETIVRRFSAVGATFTISSEVLELARTDSEWISSVIEQATALKKIKLSSGTSDNVGLEKDDPSEPKSYIDQPAQSQSQLVQSSPALIPPEGGYDDEIFLSPPSKDLICPICQLTLREPHQLTCCGSTLCQVCTYKTGAKLQCPCCRDADHTVMLDKKTRRQIVSLKVKCTKPDCYWYGELLNLNTHWNKNCPMQYQQSLFPEWAYPVLSTLQHEMIPVYRTVEQFRMNKDNEAELYTDPFYTAQGGYKMTLRVHPNGEGLGKGTHISVYISLMKGENDHNLPFPFSGIFNIKLLNWKQDTGHVGKSVPFNETTQLKCRQQVTTGQVAATGPGYNAFLSHTKLMEESSDHQYLYEDKFSFKILFESINQTGPPVPSWCDKMNGVSATPPCTRTLYSYSTYKRANRAWISLPFYSGDKRYKLVMVVWPSGSVGIDLLKREHDDSLKWPLTADITIQLLNWREDKNHQKWTFYHDPSRIEGCKRVTQGDTVPAHLGYRRQFITDSVLEISSKTEYIKNDNLCFRIVSVNVL